MESPVITKVSRSNCTSDVVYGSGDVEGNAFAIVPQTMANLKENVTEEIRRINEATSGRVVSTKQLDLTAISFVARGGSG